MKVKTVHAPPLYWSDPIAIASTCGARAHYKEIKVSSKSNAKSTFGVRIHMPTSFSPIEFIGPGEKKFLVPEECFNIKVSLKSHTVGQVVRCEVSP